MMMDKKQRRDIIYQIGDIFEMHCKGCKYSIAYDSRRNNNEHCHNECEHGKKLKILGDKLDPYGVQNKRGKKKEEEDDSMASITQKAYESMKKEGKSDTDIAKYFGVKQPTLAYHKKKWYEDKKSDDEFKKMNEEINVTNEKLKEDNLELKKKNEELLKKLDELTAACEDLETESNNLLENEIARLQKELSIVQKKNYDLENLFKALKPFLKITI